ncbi:MAG: AzlD domain-containing protein [Clostridia bacterium]|nr:AzlD domain-containing protein [Clostridia bacterium]
MKDFFIYLLIMAGSTYLIRALPFSLFSKKIKSPFVRSFLYYIPYTVLTAMTLPAALYATGSILSAAVGLAVAILVSLKSKSLTLVALSSAVAVGLCECVLLLF